MKLNELIQVKNIKKAKRLGRGESSGKGKTSGKGSKGQKVRGKIRLGFEGGQLPIIKRLPFKRGIGNSPAATKITLTLSNLKAFSEGETVDYKSLLEKGLISKSLKPRTIKVVAKGELDRALKVGVKTTLAAKKLIEKAKGEVINIQEKKEKADV